MERRLSAILAADVVGYAQLMGEDETGTLEALKEHRVKLFDPKAIQHGGRTIKLMGDGILMEFTSVVDAVNFAVQVQTAVQEGNASVSPKRKIVYRIGINLGDVIVDGDDIYGDGVNVASRLEALAEPGGITISDQVFYSLDGTMSGTFCDGGEYQLKNIDRSVRVWHWPNAPEANAQLKTDKDKAQDNIPLIVIEEFASSGDAETSADLTEELRSEILEALSHRTGIRIATPTKENEKPTYLLSGRCRVTGNRCRLHLSLAIASNGESFWTSKIDRKLSDLFEFLDEAVSNISSALRTQINAYAGMEYASQADSELTFQQLLSKAAFHFYRHDTNSVAISRQTMEAAILLAPENPMALAMHSYAIMQTVPMALERVEDINAEAAISYADQSVYFGPNVDFAFRNRGRIRLWLSRDHEGCRADANRALTINPHYHVAKEELSFADVFGGQVRKGIETLEDLIRDSGIEPWHTPYRESMLGLAYALVGDTAAAIEHAKEGYEQRPFLPIHAIAYAVAACEDVSITKTREFRSMVDRHGLRVSDADRFPFTTQDGTAIVAAKLHRSGILE